MNLKWILIFLLSNISLLAAAQDTTSTLSSNSRAGYIISGALITTGIVLNKEATKSNIQEWVRERWNVPKTQIDDYLQYAPLAMLYAGDLILDSNSDEIKRHTRHMLVSQAMTLGLVYMLKASVGAKRPSGGSLSFPSGHTAHAFGVASVMYYSFKDQSKWLAYSGYLPAIVTGVYRVAKDKHWVSDVVMSAGLGIFFAHLTYHLNIWNAKSDTNTSETAHFDMGLTPNGLGLTFNF